MQSEFIPLVEEAAAECTNYLKDRLLAFYLHGSIAFNDAVPYISDLDCYIAANGKITDEDRIFFGCAEARLDEKYPFVNGVHLNVHSENELKGDAFSRFILRYNSVLYRGADIVKSMEENGCERLLPNILTAKSRLAFAKQCFYDALSGLRPANTGELPSNTFYAARKFARYFVIIEGAYFLMTENRFTSFEKEDVMRKLRESEGIASKFESILDMTEKVLRNPLEAQISGDKYLKAIKPLAEYMFDRTEQGK